MVPDAPNQSPLRPPMVDLRLDARVRFPTAALSGGRLVVLGWDAGIHCTSVGNQPPRPSQPPTSVYWPKCGDALRLGSEGRMAHSIRG